MKNEELPSEMKPDTVAVFHRIARNPVSIIKIFLPSFTAFSRLSPRCGVFVTQGAQGLRKGRKGFASFAKPLRPLRYKNKS
jgi:hypothetical protein